jgi:hypothetical protein
VQDKRSPILTALTRSLAGQVRLSQIAARYSRSRRRILPAPPPASRSDRRDRNS